MLFALVGSLVLAAPVSPGAVPLTPEENGMLTAFTAKVVQRLNNTPGLAEALLLHTHPTGLGPSLRSIDVDPTSRASARVFITIYWTGRVWGGGHSTRIAWEFNTQRHIAATVTSDNANVPVAPDYLRKLDAYFRDVVFPSMK